MRDTTILDAAALLALAMGRGPAISPPALKINPSIPALAGVWRSEDGTVHLTLKSDHSYALSVAGRKRKAQGSYLLDGPDLRLRDDSGLRTPARLAGGAIEMAGHELLPLSPSGAGPIGG
jgi:Agrobacterium tumefaciens protein Atu4866